MSKENLKDKIAGKEKENERSQENLLLEEKLIEGYIKNSGKKPEDWIAENGKNFREIINNNPKLTDEYEKNPEATKAKIKKILEKMTKQGRVV